MEIDISLQRRHLWEGEKIQENMLIMERGSLKYILDAEVTMSFIELFLIFGGLG